MNIIITGNVQLKKRDIDLIVRLGKDKLFKFSNEEDKIDRDPKCIDAVICNWFFKYHDWTDFPNLKYIQFTSSGYNGIDIKDIQNKGITIFNARGVYSIPISESVISNLLAYYKHNSYFFQNQKKHIWMKRRKLEELYGKKILIVGTGDIGKEIAKRLVSFTPDIYGCNRTERSMEFFKKIFPLTELKTVISQMDVLILTLALTTETKYIINRTVFEKMKKGSLLINVSRGQIVNEEDLIEALNSKNIGGAILDVFENEPLKDDSPLWDIKNVIITPHNAFASVKNNRRLSKLIIDNYLSWRSKYERKSDRLD